jgi:hypothetical protein
VLSTSEVNGFLSAALHISQKQKESGAASESGAAAAQAFQVAMQLFSYPLAAAQGLGPAPTTLSATDAAAAERRCPDALSYALMVQLAAMAGQYEQVTEVVLGAVGKVLPVQARQGQQQQQQRLEVLLDPHSGGSGADSSRVKQGSGCVWDGVALQEVLAAAAGVWRSAGCGDVAIMMLDGLMVAGQEQLVHPGLAAEVIQAANMGDKEYEVSAGG